MQEKILSLLQSRRFLAASVSLLVVVFDEQLGIQLDFEKVLAIAIVVSAWIAGDSLNKTQIVRNPK